jgi:hypothetical protein
MERATGWEVNAFSPDYFNACDTTLVDGVVGMVGVPANFIGYQHAFEGQAYGGLVVFADSTVVGPPDQMREYMGIALVQPLMPGVPVCLSFRTSATQEGLAWWGQAKYRCKGIGMKFTMQPFDTLSLPPAPTNQAALYLDQMPPDTTSWVLVEGVYVPDSAYTYLIIGNFLDQVACTPVLTFPGALNPGAYAYVDDVVVTYQGEGCAGIGMAEHAGPPGLTAATDPGTGGCLVTFARPVGAYATLELIDAAGRVVARQGVPPGATQAIIDARHFTTGIYRVQLRTPDGLARPGAWLHLGR